ncbi:nucleotidyltransferase domain-containing protein [Luteolibacter yonseiensis]|uniref:Nucleotidyltransferase domain-containing protein n=1 Tax=Luteolibacter yonseiensis TaxID=1144680 RepID=A0A934VAN1_9BACT|nr:nucleotidyltransferase domain-containing protein [Luteolibacter yonseiensis]MBK1816368.1 nucleotidyltransferase domain-containing protein [Luteolibacter yonseiensis]
MNALFSIHADEIARLCEKHGVLKLSAFGSSVREDFDPETSDVDVIAVFNSTREPGYADRYLDLALSLEQLFGRAVDLLTPGSIRNPHFASTLAQEAVSIYESQDHQAA